LNRERIGLGVVAFVRVNIERHRNADAELFMKEAINPPEVTSCYITSGESDFLLQVVVPDLTGYQHFALKKLIRVPGVKDISQ
jgi:Lrp/AsnC family leucine-responsive transcriptional regulator